MIAAWAVAALIVVASVLLGRAILIALGETRRLDLAPVVGFSALVAAAPLLVRLPGRATTAAILLALAVLMAVITIAMRTDWTFDRQALSRWLAPAAVAIVVAVASLPFLFNERFGVLGEGIYTNDHAAQLYWAEWLRTGFGPEPEAVSFGYPVGPQALVAIAAQATGADLVEAFNGLLLAIPALTALLALAALGGLPPGRRLVAASLVGLPFLAAAFLAQSAFKETAMALLLIGFALALRELRPGGARRRAIATTLGLIALASVFAYSVGGLSWLVVAAAVWLAIELAAGRRPIAIAPLREALSRHRVLTAAVAVAIAAVAALATGPAIAFVERIADVVFSVGRLGSPVWPGEALGIWPEGDYRLVRSDVPGAIPATLVGLAGVCIGAWALVRRGEGALLAALVAAGAVYVGSRLVAEIHVQAKALAVMAPLVMLVSLAALLAPRRPDAPRLSSARLAFGVLFALAAALSTIGALRAAPVGFDDRAAGLERLGELAEGRSVAFLGVDRFAAYRLRGTDVRSPGGFVPPRVSARSAKTWRQGLAMDLDTLAPRVLDRFDYAVTTAAPYQSAAPPNMRPVAVDGGYVLWERTGPTPQNRVLLGERGDPGARLNCDDVPPQRRFPAGARAVVRGEPVSGEPGAWRGPAPVDPARAAAGQEGAFEAPATLTQELRLEPGRWLLSLQYHSQVPLVVEAQGRRVELPPSLDGMYLDGPGQGAFWPAGELELSAADADEPVAVSVHAAEPSRLQRVLGVERRLWLGRLAAVPAAEPETMPVVEACSRYVDRVLIPERGGS